MLRSFGKSAQTRRHASWLAVAALATVAASLAACGSDGDNESNQSGGMASSEPVPKVTIRAKVSGLTGQGLVLQSRLGETLPVTADGELAFRQQIDEGTSPSVTVKTQPISPNQQCTVEGGNAAAANGVAAVTVVCSTTSINVRGAVSGLAGAGLVLQNNAGDDLAVSSNGAFVFALPVARGAHYGVSVRKQPSFPNQQCVVTAGTGVAADADVTSVAVSCTTQASRFAYVGDYSASSVTAFTLDASSGVLASIGTVPTPFTAPLSASGDPKNMRLFVGNGNVGGLAVFAVDPATGGLTLEPGSPYPTGTSVQAVATHPSGKSVYALSLSGTITAFSVNALTGALTPIAGSPFAAGAAPRAMVLDPTGKRAYVADTGTNSLYAFNVSATGALAPAAGSPYTLAGAYNLVVNPEGTFLYVTQAGLDTIAVYAIDVNSGALTLASQCPSGAGPRGIALHASGRYLYVSNQGANTLTAYVIDPATGSLRAATTVATGAQPINLAIDESGQFLYVTNSTSDDVYMYRIDPLTGAPIAIGGAQPAAVNPFSITIF